MGGGDGFVAWQNIEVKYFHKDGRHVCQGIDWAQHCYPSITEPHALAGHGTTSREALDDLKAIIEGQCAAYKAAARSDVECKPVGTPHVRHDPLDRFAIALGDCVGAVVNWVKRVNSL